MDSVHSLDIPRNSGGADRASSARPNASGTCSRFLCIVADQAWRKRSRSRLSYQRQMKAPLRKAGIEWEGWHGFRRGLATNLERIGVRGSIAAMILRHTNDRSRASITSSQPRSRPSLPCGSCPTPSRRWNSAVAPHKCSPECSPSSRIEQTGSRGTMGPVKASAI